MKQLSNVRLRSGFEFSIVVRWMKQYRLSGVRKVEPVGTLIVRELLSRFHAMLREVRSEHESWHFDWLKCGLFLIGMTILLLEALHIKSSFMSSSLID